jgi:hypothetical protein
MVTECDLTAVNLLDVLKKEVNNVRLCITERDTINNKSVLLGQLNPVSVIGRTCIKHWESKRCTQNTGIEAFAASKLNKIVSD